MTLSDTHRRRTPPPLTHTAQLWETFRAGHTTAAASELVRGAVRLVLQELIEAEATEADRTCSFANDIRGDLRSPRQSGTA